MTPDSTLTTYLLSTYAPLIYIVVPKLLCHVRFSFLTILTMNRAIGCGGFQFGRYSSTFRRILFFLTPCRIFDCSVDKFLPDYSVSNVWKYCFVACSFLASSMLHIPPLSSFPTWSYCHDKMITPCRNILIVTHGFSPPNAGVSPGWRHVNFTVETVSLEKVLVPFRRISPGAHQSTIALHLSNAVSYCVQ